MKLIGGLNLTEQTQVSVNVACNEGDTATSELIDRLRSRLSDLPGLEFEVLAGFAILGHENRLTVSAIEACELVGWATMALTELEAEHGFEYHVEVWTAMEW